MNNDDVLQLFESCGALLTGHFVLTSGRHAHQYFEKFDVLRSPEHVETLCHELAQRVRLANIDVDVVMGPTTLGIVLAYEMGRQLNRPAAYAEKGNGHARILRRPDHLPASSRVLIVDDVLTTGGSVRECMDLVERCGATVAGVAVLVDRAGGSIEFGAPLVSTLSLNVESWDAAEVPASLAAIPITRPGSTGKK